MSNMGMKMIASHAKLKRTSRKDAWLVIRDGRTIGWIEKEAHPRHDRIRWYAMGPNGQIRWGFSKRFLAVGNLMVEFMATTGSCSARFNSWIENTKNAIQGAGLS